MVTRQLRAIARIALVAMVPLVFYFTTQGTWHLRNRSLDGNFSRGFFMAQADSLVRARLDVPPWDIGSECFERDSRCYGYFGITPSLLRVPFLGILRWLRSALTPLYLGLAILVAYWAALQMLQRSLREHADPSAPRALVVGYAIAGALALGPGSTLLLIARPAIYEEAAAWGVAFVLLALNHVWAWHARERQSVWPAVVLGIAAANARPTAATACAVLGLVVAALWYFRNLQNRRVLVAALLLSLLPGLTAASVFWLKFRTPAPDLRLNKEVRDAPHWRKILATNGNETGGLMFMPTALVAYFRPDAVTLRPEWPYVDFRFPRESIKWMPPLPEGGAYVEPVTSLTTTMPLPWILNVTVAAWLCVQGARLAARGRRAGSPPRPTLTGEQWLFAAGMLTSAAAMAVLTVTTVGITNRYLSDFYATSVVGVALGHRVVIPFLRQRAFAAGLAALFAVVLVGWSVLVTLSLGTRLALG